MLAAAKSSVVTEEATIHVLSWVLSEHFLQTREQNTPSIVNTTLINCMSPAIPPCRQFFFFTALQNMKWKLRKVRKSENRFSDFLTLQNYKIEKPESQKFDFLTF